MCPLQPKMIHAKFFEFWFNSLTKEEYRKIPFPASFPCRFQHQFILFPFQASQRSHTSLHQRS